jgi:hypothetical protein
MIDLAKQNDRILFVSNYDQIKSQKVNAVSEASTHVPLNPKIEQQVKQL